jgi:predicted nucleotidyltransferase
MLVIPWNRRENEVVCGSFLRLGRYMTREQVLARLREHRQELECAGIVRLAIFGSVARGENTPQSDVDLMGDFDRAKRLNLFDMVGLELRLTEIVGTRVELSDRKMLKPPVKLVAEREAVLAF